MCTWEPLPMGSCAWPPIGGSSSKHLAGEGTAPPAFAGEAAAITCSPEGEGGASKAHPMPP